MKTLLIAFIAISSALVVSAQDKVVCYYGSWATYRPGNGKFDVADINPNLCTHLIYSFFGIEDNGAMRSLDDYLDYEENWGRANIKHFNNLKQQNPNLKTLVAVGGWNEGSVKYSNMAKDPARRRRFVESARDILIKHGFDGLDMDWEYPGQREGDPHADKANFVTLLREIKEEFNKYGFLLTAAVGVTENSAEQSYDIPGMSKYLDFINLMTYDLHGSWDNKLGINAPMYAGPNDQTANERQMNVDSSVNYWLSKGAPASKLVLGIPLYGRTFTLQDPSRNSIGSASTGGGAAGPYTREPGILGYNEICENFKQGWTIQWDNTQKVPYAFKDRQWVGYDNEESIQIKGDYVHNKRLGGMMVWSIETDDFRGVCGEKYPLMRKINTIIRPGYVPGPGTGGGSGGSGGSGGGTGGGSGGSGGSGGGSTNCAQDGTFRDPSNCANYYQCVGGIKYPFTCPAGTVFDLNTMNCNWPDQVQC